MMNIKNNKRFKIFLIGFLAGFLPTFIFLVLDEPLFSIWSLLIGLIVGFLTLLFFWVYEKQKIIGICLFIALSIAYVIYLLILWEYRNGFFGGKFIG